MNGVLVLAKRELVRFFRQPSRLFGSLAQPLLFWIMMGAGFADSFSYPAGDVSYSEFFFPGILLMLLLFAAIFSTITLIEDRTAGFLQGVMVAPISRLSLVLGKLVGGTSIAVFQAMIFMLFAPLAGMEFSLGVAGRLLALFLLTGLGFTGLGFIVAWVTETVSGYHAIMSVVMIPLWLLSGAVFPSESAAGWLQWVMRFNPITYAQIAIRSAFYLGWGELVRDDQFLLALCISAAWTGLMLAGSVAIVVRKGDV